TDGRVLTRDADGHKVRLESARGEIITYQQNARGEDVPKEYERSNHSKLTFDKEGNVLAATDARGQKRSVDLKDGKVVGFGDETGKWVRGPEAEKGKPQIWLKDGQRHIQHLGDVSMRPDGTFVKTDDIHQKSTSFRSDGSRDVLTEVKR